MFFLLSLYMQEILGFSALKTGVGYLAVALTAIVASGVGAGADDEDRREAGAGDRPRADRGGLILFTQIPVDGSYVANLLPGFLLVGVGLGFSFVPVSIAALSGIQPRRPGSRPGLINTSQQIGGALGVAILTTVFTTRSTNLIEDGTPQPDAFVSGFSAAFWVAAAFAAISIVATLLLLRRSDLQSAPAGAVVG